MVSTSVMEQVSEPLTKPEKAQLARCESQIKSGLATFIEVGRALSEISTNKLYRASSRTFEDYCKEQWEMTDRHARHLIDAAGVADNLKTGTKVLPANERQVRPLARLEPEQQREAWRVASTNCVKENPTSMEVEIAARYVSREASNRKGGERNGAGRPCLSTWRIRASVELEVGVALERSRKAAGEDTLGPAIARFVRHGLKTGLGTTEEPEYLKYINSAL